MNPLNETKFEEHIADYLAASPLYNQRTSAQFDIDNLVDKEMLEHFLQAQTISWQKLQEYSGSLSHSLTFVSPALYAAMTVSVLWSKRRIR